MTKANWKKNIIKAAKKVGTYDPAYDKVIETLAGILEQRDAAYDAFLDDGRLVIEKVSDRGAVNMAKNPLLTVWQDLNTQALAYWRDLGLTPAGLKRINDAAALKKSNGSVLEEALKSIGT